MGLLVIAGFFVLFMLGFPIALAIALPSVFYVFYNHIPIDLLAQRMHYSLDSYPLLAVPVFIFVGNLMNSTGITNRIFKFADTLVGRLPGGLAQVNIFASLIFSGMSGAALADVGGLGQIEINAMKKKGFEASFAAAVTAGSATVGPIFPPSIPLVIYGAVAGVSIVKLLIAGIVPAVIAVVAMMILTAILSIIRKYPRAERWPTFYELFLDFFPALPALLAPILLIAGMLTGVFTPTEAASGTAFYVILIGAFVYRDLTFKHLVNSAFETIKASTGILLIIAAASLFGWILTVELIPQMFAKSFLSFSKNPYVLLALVNVILIVVGMFLDSTTATILLVPIIAKPLMLVGVDPVHLGIVTVFNLMIGLLTPPMGLSLFMISDIADVPISGVLKSVFPYFITLILALMLLTFYPPLTLWLPGLLR
jgi:tripartite ATP-independent transporter DctM subunit